MPVRDWDAPPRHAAFIGRINNKRQLLLLLRHIDLSETGLYTAAVSMQRSRSSLLANTMSNLMHTVGNANMMEEFIVLQWMHCIHTSYYPVITRKHITIKDLVIMRRFSLIVTNL